MNLYLVTPKVPNVDYEQVTEFVAVSESAEKAVQIHPWEGEPLNMSREEAWREDNKHRTVMWVRSPQDVYADLIGTAADHLKEGQILCWGRND